MHRLVIALTALLGLAGAAIVAFFLLLGAAGTDRAAAAAPASTLVYLNVFLQPSSAERAKLSALLGRLPGFGDAATMDEKIDQVAQNLLGQVGFDYRADLKPWLGNQLAIAMGPPDPAAARPSVLVIVDVKDRPAAEAALPAVVGSGGATPQVRAHGGVDLQLTETGGWAFLSDDLVVISQQPTLLEASVDAAGSAPSLADAPGFRGAMDGLPADHLASIFVDLTAVADAAGAPEAVAGYPVLAATLVAEEGGLRLDGRAPIDRDAAGSSVAALDLGSEAASLSDWMPAETRGEATVFGFVPLLQWSERVAELLPLDPSLSSTIDTLRSALAALPFAGIDLEGDLLPLLDGEVGIAFAGVADDGLPRGQLLLRPSNAQAAADALQRMVDALRTRGASVRTEAGAVTVVSIPLVGELAFAEMDGIVVMGLHAEDVTAATQAHDSGQALATSGAYRTAFDLAGARAGSEVWLDLPALLELAGVLETLPADVRDILERIGAVALTVASRQDQIEFHAVLTVE